VTIQRQEHDKLWPALFDHLVRADGDGVVDPGPMVRLARANGLGAMLYHKQRSHRALWGDAFDVLEADHERSIFDDLESERALQFLYDTFQEACRDDALNHEPIALKGAHLKRTVYRDAPHVRTMGDIDLLVHKMDRENMTSLMRNLGFSRVPDAGPAYHRALGHAQTWHKMTPENHVLRIDVHHRFTHRMRGGVLPLALFSQIVRCPGSPPLRVLGPEDLIAHLVIHLSHEFFRGPLKGLIDLHLVLRDQLKRGDTRPAANFPVAARPGLAVALGLLVRLEAWAPDALWAGVSPATGRRFERLFPTGALFDGKKGRAQARENTLRSLYLIDHPGLRLLYPAYLGTVQLSRRLQRLTAWRSASAFPSAEGP
jgi:hypothetical protein